MTALYNKKNKEQLIEQLKKENFNRLTLSFYRYVNINKNLDELRDHLYEKWSQINILGRIYIAKEGINAQISVPENKLKKFKTDLSSYEEFKNIELKFAVEEKISFYKLIIKVKNEIVAYKIKTHEYDMNETGKHLNAQEFNELINQKNSIVVDMRNHYESEVGKFENAICPDVDTSEELLPETKKILQNNKEDNILLYCTGGIRCEKASSYLIKNKFKNVFQLKGGVVQYAHQIQKNKIESKFKGKNFVFDDRLGERITGDILSDCHQCEKPCDDHINCANDACHLLFIQCEKCKKIYDECCSKECREIIKLPIEEQRILRRETPNIAAPLIHHYRDRLRPKLKEMQTKKNTSNQ
tara:strand:+ start:2626 stop:3693 length:1068 start_codon:yes stop_codon:yes gene_type:complete